MKIGILKENPEEEKRVALIPENIPSLIKAGFEVYIEEGAGGSSGFSDVLYNEKGAKTSSREEILKTCDIILCIRKPSSLHFSQKKQVLIGLLDPFADIEKLKELAGNERIIFSLELIPRITRAQGMDILSSMATIAGYKSVIIAAGLIPKIFPMLMTAAGTITPAKVFVIGAGVAGLQAIATAKRLGAVVYSYDIRPSVKEQIESLGAKFVEIPIETEDTEEGSGYAKAMSEEFYKRQREVMRKIIKESDVVISTAAVPGKKAPILITEDMVKEMKPGSVIVDLAAERGGNCEITEIGKVIKKYGVTIVGYEQVASMIPYHASQLYSRNITNFLLYIYRDGKLNLSEEDEIIRDTMVIKDGKIISPILRNILNL